MAPNKQLANIITISRILGVGLIFWFTPFQSNLLQLWAIIIYTVICTTDFLDGYIARRYKMVSDFGKIADPLADKILVLVLLPLLQMQAITAFPVFIILSREFIVMGIRVYAAKQGSIIDASLSGKLKTAITLPVCGLLFARIPVIEVALPHYLVPLNLLRLWVLSWPEWVMSSLILAMVIITLWSLWDYIKGFVWQLYISKNQNNPQKAKKKLLLLIPNSITMLNLGCGIFASIFAWGKLFHPAVLLVLLGTLLDALDGRLARRLGAYSKFGAKLDSKADFVNFGIAPAIVIYSLLSDSHLLLGLAMGFIYYISVHYRLKRFDKGGHSDIFEGLPSPVGAGLVVIAAVSAWLSTPILFSALSILIAGLMASRIPYPHLDFAKKETFLKYLKYPILIFLTLTMLHLLKINVANEVFAYEILFGLCSIYLLYPLFNQKKN